MRKLECGSQEKGSIEVGKVADFVFLDADLMSVKDSEIPKIKVLQTFVSGQKVF